MCRFRSAFSLVLMVWLSGLCTSAFAQDGQWVGDLRLVSVHFESEDWSIVLIDEDDNVHAVLPNVASAMGGFPEESDGEKVDVH